VDGRGYDPERLRLAVQEGKSGKPIEMIVENSDHYRTVRIGYTGGLRYPHLEKIAGEAALIDEIFFPKQ
jgi:hypothetical protein